MGIAEWFVVAIMTIAALAILSALVATWFDTRR